MPNLNTRILEQVPLLIAHDEVLASFSRIVDPIQSLIEQRNCESAVLAENRDALLPKLLSGELSVPAPNDKGGTA